MPSTPATTDLQNVNGMRHHVKSNMRPKIGASVVAMRTTINHVTTTHALPKCPQGPGAATSQ
eukprot:9059427-Lingulodinium_polyedra.AAC.1